MSRDSLESRFWQFNWKISVFTLAFLPVLIGLGFWQLDRALEKQALLDSWAIQQDKEAVYLLDLDLDEQHKHRPVHVYGEFLTNKYWLQEGKIVNGQTGYNVIMPFLLEDDSIVLVDRGWVIGSKNREQLPVVETPQYRVGLEGRIAPESDVAFIDERNNPLLNWPHRLLKLDVPVMSQQFGETLREKVVRLNESDPLAFFVPPISVSITPEKHRAYAIQWFGMAFTLVVLWVFANSTLYSRISKILPKDFNR